MFVGNKDKFILILGAKASFDDRIVGWYEYYFYCKFIDIFSGS